MSELVPAAATLLVVTIITCAIVFTIGLTFLASGLFVARAVGLMSRDMPDPHQEAAPLPPHTIVHSDPQRLLTLASDFHREAAQRARDEAHEGAA